MISETEVYVLVPYILANTPPQENYEKEKE
jgi:hypothetical protein